MSRTIQLSQGKVAVVDDEDYSFLARFAWHNTPWGATTFRGGAGRQQRFFMARLITLAPDDLECVHKDGDLLNNRKSNLLLLDHGCGALYQARPGHPEYKGLVHKRGKWMAQLSWKRRPRYLGYYEDDLLAALSYDLHCREWGLARELNFGEDEFLALMKMHGAKIARKARPHK